jgi:carbonic anhydrase
MCATRFTEQDQDLYDRIFRQNKEWATNKKNSDRRFFKRHFKAQNPQFLYIGCSDSRVPIGDLTGMDIGDIFVHRNIANLVNPEDENTMAVLRYGVEFLKIKHIVVSGHYGCGGVQAANSEQHFGALDNWLKPIRILRQDKAGLLDLISDKEAENDKLAEFNVLKQCQNLMQLDFIQESIAQKAFPKIHAWIYDMRKGLLKDLNFDMLSSR